MNRLLQTGRILASRPASRPCQLLVSLWQRDTSATLPRFYQYSTTTPSRADHFSGAYTAAKFAEKAENIGKKKNSVSRVVAATGGRVEDMAAVRGREARSRRGSKPTDLLKCFAITTAERYDFETLLPRLQRTFTITPITSDVYHLRAPSVAPEHHDGAVRTTLSPAAAAQSSPSNSSVGTPRLRTIFEAERDRLEALRSLSSNHSAPAVTDTRCDMSNAGAVVDPVTGDPFDQAEVHPTGSGSRAAPLFPDDAVAIIPPDGEVFLFQSGTYVCWGLTTSQVERFLREIIEATPGAEVGKYDEVEVEDAPFRMANPSAHHSVTSTTSGTEGRPAPATTGMVGETIVIAPSPDPLLAKLAFSHGVARSAKLAVLEELLDRYLHSTANLPRILQRGHKIPWSRSQVLQQLGELLHFRMMLNLHSESFLDTPEYYWTKPQLEAYYDTVCRNLDIVPRTRVLNTKLDYANELATVLREQLSETHSLNLEWCIILLIAVEVGFELIHYYEKYVDRPGKPVEHTVAASEKPKVVNNLVI
ncbi:hypothetical protein IWQ60_009296 [Tieghemiomyces parasiticus]|uniref:DUF155 domain-containing protein n=1 Tax=Tieghemiomyces parasiticus TaxID=78921 RepID=A0A9W8DPT6_9FUNG|nr:hypothetical protein IWQ60_009296 [Tieghemiomyces parasiticus]